MTQDLLVLRVGPDLREAAAARLVSPRPGPDRAAGRRFLANAEAHGIDVSLFWASFVQPKAGAPLHSPAAVQHACLAVLGPGGVASLFLSATPAGRVSASETEEDLAHRVAVVNEACRVVAGEGEPGGGQIGRKGRLAQALLEPQETASMAALSAAGFTRLGDLAYLRRPVPRRPAREEPVLPEEVTLTTASALPEGERDAVLMRALARSYIETLDCPELTGLRTLPDVLESHRAVGRYDPDLWWVILHRGEPEGCMLLARSPELRSVELVYLGLGPELRSKGLGSALLSIGMNRIAGGREPTLTCAVDTRNTPAQRLYRRAGFERFALRTPMIRALAE